MTCDSHSAGFVELYFYGELPAEARAEMQAHLTHCVICAQAFRDLSMIRAALATRPDVATPPAGDWSGFMARLDLAIARDAANAAGVRQAARLLRMPRAGRVVTYATAAALLALVTATVLMVSRPGSVPASPDERALPASDPPAMEAVGAVPQPDAALMSVSGAHFERSKLVVLGLATRRAEQLGAEEWGRERARAATLLNDTRLYRVAAEQRGMSTLAGVMRDLELVLLQTSMSEAPDASSIEQLQRLIRRRDLLTKMNVVATSSQ